MNKTVILFLNLMFIFSLSAYSQSIDIFEANGWLESAYLKWHSSGSLESYNVYYSGGGFTNKKIDSPLIRNMQIIGGPILSDCQKENTVLWLSL